ncbi:hypothetical protein KNT64_gp001 [Pseudomonas phage PspYZU05]|uniref:Uncharacterized protein n=1 Tax=Pseudomonas phage PspYZU05 TaxID=1983556 RepID=A0A2U7N870_9CAUD|nr:hypothetical protein KNT64_gp001 [Pseudomonas phage PspYZU05]ASD51953.1 hypothetical protein PspYZU05_01 [Pseudomonas phage PspYZU05]
MITLPYSEAARLLRLINAKMKGPCFDYNRMKAIKTNLEIFASYGPECTFTLTYDEVRFLHGCNVKLYKNEWS